MADANVLFDSACDRVLECFKVENLKDLQRKALEKLVNGEDVFVIQPTGSGKSLISLRRWFLTSSRRQLSNPLLL